MARSDKNYVMFQVMFKLLDLARVVRGKTGLYTQRRKAVRKGLSGYTRRKVSNKMAKVRMLNSSPADDVSARPER